MFSNPYNNINEGRNIMYKFLKITAYVLVLVGAINWGLVGLYKFDLVATLFGEMTRLTRIVYILVGLSAIFSAITTYMCCKKDSM